MTKTAYHFLDGRNQLVAVPCSHDGKGNLTKEGEKEPFCTGAKESKTPADGCFTVEAAPAPAAKKKEEEPAK